VKKSRQKGGHLFRWKLYFLFGNRNSAATAARITWTSAIAPRRKLDLSSANFFETVIAFTYKRK
jgi:hypothetical protein